MIWELNITIQPQDENNQPLIQKKLREALAIKLNCHSEFISESNVEKRPRNKFGVTKGEDPAAQKINFKFVKKSIDARHGRQKFVLRYKAFTDDEAEKLETKIVWKNAAPNAKKIIIVGSGPAGLFAALKFLEHGIQPIIIERGKNTSDRKRDIAAISTRGVVDIDSNYCFGEGGAGTFSDGKLYTRSDKRGNVGRIMQIFCEFGADKKILTDSHAHIGTDKLPQIINAMRQKIISLGGEFHFGMRCVDLLVEKLEGIEVAPQSLKVAEPVGAERFAVGERQKVVRGVLAADTATGEQKEFLGDAVMLATGHSACDIYELIARVAPNALEAKTFAVGVRVEHPRELIDSIQYHIRGDHYHGAPERLAVKNALGAAEYRLTSQIEGRGVYTFCMCPGGFVVPSATEPESIVLNGMSSAKRNSRWSNAAIVVETYPGDIPQKFLQEAREGVGIEALAPLYFRKWLEHETFLHGDKKSQAAPAQLVQDFLQGKLSRALPDVSYTPSVVSSRLDEWLPPQIARRLAGGLKEFNKKMHGFISPEAVIMASETRTSTPVRILRDRKTFECIALKNLYPCGEGSGYSGGIVSSAMDGENAATALLERLG